VNDAGHESGVPLAVAGGATIPLLQDTAGVGAWALWSVAYRDLVILDDANGAVGTFNFTELNLFDPWVHDEVKAYLRLQAGE
jgi:hypothetical protein